MNWPSGARLRFAKLRHRAGLDRTLFLKLVASDWIDAHANLAICRPAGVGRNWLACALSHKACRDDPSVLYQRFQGCSPAWCWPRATDATRVGNACSATSSC